MSVRSFTTMATICIGLFLLTRPTSKGTNRQAIQSTTLDHNAYLQQLFQKHPKTEVSESLWQEIASGHVQLEWNQQINTIGHFSWDPHESIGINPTYVFRAMRSTFDQHRLMAGLYHEAIHHRQYHDGLFKNQTCDTIWLTEREAYQEECLLAKELGIDQRMRLCRAMKTGMFENVLIDGLIERDSNFAACAHLRDQIAHNSKF